MPSALRTYLFIDLVGYGDVLRTDDAQAARLLGAYRRLVRRHLPDPPAATIQEVVSDTFHVAFRSARDAVRTAIQIVRAAYVHNKRATVSPLRIGIGIHAGETIRQDGNFVGSAVEVAMRLSHAAEPGQILTTETVYGLLRTANIAPMHDLGVWGPHGLGQTIRVYEVRVPGVDRTDSRGAHAARRLLLAVLFTDIAHSTSLAVDLGDREWGAIIERHHAAVRAQLKHWGGREVDTAGDGFFATFESPSRAIGCAISVRDAVRDIGLEIRAGIHVGECEIVAGKVAGIAVVVGARIREAAAPGQVLLSQTVKDVVSGAGFVFEARAVRPLKGVPGRWKLYAAEADSS